MSTWLRGLGKAVQGMKERREKKRIMRQNADARNQALQILIQRYRFDPYASYAKLGLTIVRDPDMNAEQALTYVPIARLVHLQPRMDENDQRMALTMLLVHLARTRPQSDDRLTAYIVDREDLSSIEGPAANARWKDYMLAMQALAPMPVVLALLHAKSQNPPIFVRMVLGISSVCYRQLMNDLQHNAAPVVDPEMERTMGHLVKPNDCKATVP